MENLTSIKVYSLFGANGKMEELKPVQSLPMFTKVFNYGYAMNRTTGAIISGPDEFGNYQCVEICEDQPEFFNLDKYARPYSKVFGIGVYYADNLETFDESLVLKCIELAKIEKARKQDEAVKIAEYNKNQVNNLPKLYPHLKANPINIKEEKANLVAELKKNFPTIKFSVTKDGYSTIRIKWENGPTVAEVEAISDKFESYKSSYCGDYRDPAPTNFNNVFGGFKYVFTSRSQSADINALLPKMVELLGDYNGKYPEQILYRIFCKMSIPVNAYNFDIVATDIKCGSIEDFYIITYLLPTKIEESKKETILGKFELVNYSDKALAIFGDTRPIRDKLKALGGRFNPCLTNKGQRVAGWIFPIAKQDQILSILN
jgi:hypothetical protein